MNSIGWPSSKPMWTIFPDLCAVIEFITFIASIMSNVSPTDTEEFNLIKVSLPGSGDEYAVPTIGELTAPGCLLLNFSGFSSILILFSEILALWVLTIVFWGLGELFRLFLIFILKCSAS